jgi:enoyl-CoA hydratase
MSIRVDISESIATLTIDRPAVRNALNRETVEECLEALGELAGNDEAGAVIITGAGESAFVSGSDINEIRERTRDDGLAAIASSLCSAVDHFPRPTIAAVNGYALGGGCELALACDVRIASENAVFGQPEPAIGIIPGAGATQRLPRVVGLGRAKEMILTGARWDARQALAYGLVSEVVPLPELMKTARAIAERVLALSPLAVRLSKLALNASASMPLQAGLLYESTAQAITFESKDKQEGTTAFLEKRKPAFTGD